MLFFCLGGLCFVLRFLVVSKYLSSSIVVFNAVFLMILMILMFFFFFFFVVFHSFIPFEPLQCFFPSGISGSSMELFH